MVITSRDWRINGALLQWLAESHPGLPAAAFEAAYRLLSDPDVTEEEAAAVEVLLSGCQDAASGAVAATGGTDGVTSTEPPRGADAPPDGGHASVDREEGVS
jgi:hypothetical protein